MARKVDLNREGIHRLNDVAQQALNETQSKIDNLQLILDDYTSLKERLITLPDKLSYKIMVPFGKVGFMPGQLINTNQVTILLGDNWFVKTSTKHASEMVDRRKAKLQLRVDEFKKQKQLIESRQKYTSEIIHENEECVEIVEDYDYEEELKWKERHKENIKKSKQKQSLPCCEQNVYDNDEEDEIKLLNLLEELEKRENNENINDSVIQNNSLFYSLDYNDSLAEKDVINLLNGKLRNEIDEAKFNEQLHITNSDTVQHNDKPSEYIESVRKSVKWEDEEIANETDEEDKGSNDDYDDDELKNNSITVHFKHTQNAPTPCTNCSDAINTPGDIYRIYKNKPRSILKKMESKETITNKNNTLKKNKPQVIKYDKIPESSYIDACSATVMERHIETNIGESTKNISMNDNSAPSNSNENLEPCTHVNKVSQFKANRLKKLKQ